MSILPSSNSVWRDEKLQQPELLSYTPGGALEARWHLGCVLYSLTCRYVLADARACPTGVYDTKRRPTETFIHINRNLYPYLLGGGLTSCLQFPDFPDDPLLMAAFQVEFIG